MITWIDNHLQTIIDVTQRLYGELNCKIEVVTDIKKLEKAWGITNFCDDGEILVSLDAELPYLHMCEILAHELAHVVNGKDSEEHGKEWQTIFENIHDECKKESEIRCK